MIYFLMLAICAAMAATIAALWFAVAAITGAIPLPTELQAQGLVALALAASGPAALGLVVWLDAQPGPAPRPRGPFR